MKYLLSRTFFILSLFCFSAGLIAAQTGPVFPGQDTLNVYLASGENQILVPLPEALTGKNLQLEATSSDPEILEIKKIDYSSGHSFATVRVQEKGTPGKITLQVGITYDDGSESVDVAVKVIPFNNPGLIYQVHDIVFWQEAIPLKGIPIYETITQTGEIPYNQLNYDEIPLTVNMDCVGGPCTGHDFYTSFLKGYVVPPVDGIYHFYMRSGDSHTLWLSPNEKFGDAEKIVARSGKHGNVGTEIGDQTTKSEPVQLQAGKAYAIYATQWIIHSTFGGIMWDGPGINKQFLPGENTMPVYGVAKPAPAGILSLPWRSYNSFLINWEASADHKKLAGYNVYLNGYRINNEPVSETEYLVESLSEESTYQVLVTAVDNSGIESYISNIVNVETYILDNNPPTPPQNLEVLQATGVALHLKWSGASDAETDVIGYNLYVNNVLYNLSDYIVKEDVIIQNLLPETEYTILLEAVDGGFNVSDKSAEFKVLTAAFDPTGPNLGEKVAKVIVHNNNTSWNEGIGINGPYTDGLMVNNPQVRQLVKDLQAGAVRWGAIDANSRSLAASTGTGKANTYGKMMTFANEIGARFSLTVGVQNGLDYMTDPNTFLHLLEYLAGPADTEWGAIRASEGFEEPLLQSSKGLLLEFGNEVWGAGAHDAQIGADYNKYAKWVRDMSDVVKSSPYYDPKKIILVSSGRSPHPGDSWGANTKVLTGDRGHVESLGVSGYMGGNLSYDPEIPQGDSELDYYKNSQESAKRNIDGLLLTMQEMLKLTGTLKTFYLYESNMTTSSYNGRFGQAIVLTDYLANSMNYGSIVPSIFHLTGGEWRITQPADNYKKLPLYHTAQYFNRFCKGHILESDFISNNIITNHKGKVINADPVGSYAYNSGEQFSVLLMNRDFENDFTVQVELPSGLNFAENATVYTIWQNDFSSFETNIDSIEVNLSGNLLVNVPKYAMVIVSIQGDDPGYEQLPLGYYARVRPESMTITSTQNFTVNTHRGTDEIQATILPENAFSTDAILDIIENTTESILTPLSGNRLRIKGSGKCEDEGYVKIHIYAADNHTLSDTVTVLVTNQGIDCPGTSAELLDKDGLSLFYPNPANEKIYFSQSLDNRSLVEIYDSQGRKVLQSHLEHGYEISVESLKPGLYIIGLLKPDGTYSTGKMQKN